MSESVVGQHSALNQLKNGVGGDLSLKNGRLYVNGTTYTTIGTATYYPEAVKGNAGHPLREAKNATTHTGTLEVRSGSIYATGYGYVTLKG